MRNKSQIGRVETGRVKTGRVKIGRVKTGRAARFVALLAALALLAAACGSDEDSAGDAPIAAPSTSTSIAAPSTTAPSTTASSTTAPAANEDPCTLAVDTPAKVTSTLVSSGNSYSYTTEIPSGYSPNNPSPLVFIFHGRGSNGGKIVKKIRYAELAEQENFVLVYPTALNILNTGTSWEVPQFDTDFRDDVQFVRDLVETVNADLCIDTDRIYAVGSSNGGYFVSSLVCEMADVFAAVIMSAGITHYEGCSPSQPVALLEIHGDEDATVPYFGGGSVMQEGRSAVVFSLFDAQVVEDFFNQVVPDEVAEFAADFGCTEVTESEVTSDVRLIAHTGCADPSVEVLHYRVLGSGHGWAGSGKRNSQGELKSTLSFDLTSESWAFLSQFTLTSRS